jgi:hypothetical protein
LLRVITPFKKIFHSFMLFGMQRTLTLPPADSFESESNPIFNVLIAYEDFETGKHAKETYDVLAENLGRDCHLTNQMWKFDVLSIPKLREIAVRDATLADIIIFSSHGDTLPDYVLKWTESWLMEGTRAMALVALFDRPDDQGGAVPARQYLADIASRAQMEFFAQSDVWRIGHPGSNADLPERVTMPANRHTLSSLAGVVRRDVTPRWGINE